MLDLISYAMAIKKAKAYTDLCISQFPRGLVYRGAVNYYSDLPDDAETGDTYTVKYIGSDGASPYGREYGWGSYEGTEQWILLSGLSDIKNADGESIVSDGIAHIPMATTSAFGVSKPDGSTITIDASGVLHSGITIHELPPEIASHSFTSITALIEATNAAISGRTMFTSNTYYGGIYTNSMIPKPDGTYFSGNIEVQISVVENTSGAPVYIYEIFSVTDSPYLWTCYAVNDGRNTGWVTRPLWSDFSSHTEKVINSTAGAHNLRYYNGKLQYDNGGTWTTLSIAELMI